MNTYFKIISLFFLSALLFCSCAKELSVESNTTPIATTATGTLKDTSGNCLPAVVVGTYYEGVIPGDTNYVQVQVNAFTTGSYSISTDIQNGLQFSATGVFNNTGINTVKLKTSGTPVNIASTNYNVTFDGNTCVFTVNVKDSTGTGLGGNTGGTTGPVDSTAAALNMWKFTANGHTYSGKIIGALFTTLNDGLSIFGSMQSGSTDSTFGVSVQFAGNSLDTGSFSTVNAGNNFSFVKMNGDVIFAANAITTPPVMSINIISYSSSTKIVKGTFSGISYDFNGNNVPITYGSFQATVTTQ
jgi:hypothetical protein